MRKERLTMKNNLNSGFLVKEVSQLTGLSRQVIRKWEDRYEIVHPKRHDNGYRLYTKEDVGTLLEVCELRDQGYSVKEAIRLYRQGRLAKVVQKQPLNEYVEALLKKGYNYDEAGLIQVLKQAHHRYGLERFLSTTIQPTMFEIGEKWMHGEWDESQETITSLVIRDFLVQIRRDFELPAGAPKILGCCLPGEVHEIPLHILLLQAMMSGWQTIAAGPSPKLTSIEYLVQRLHPKKLLLSATTSIPFQSNPKLYEELEAMAERNPEVEFYLGGQGTMDNEIFLKTNHIRIANSLDSVLESK